MSGCNIQCYLKLNFLFFSKGTSFLYMGAQVKTEEFILTIRTKVRNKRVLASSSKRIHLLIISLSGHHFPLSLMKMLISTNPKILSSRVSYKFLKGWVIILKKSNSSNTNAKNDIKFLSIHAVYFHEFSIMCRFIFLKK